MMLPDRATDTIPTTRGAIFGEPIDGPAEWVAHAAESEAFAEQTTRIFWRRVFQRDPYSCEADEFERLWREFLANGRDVDAMLGRMVTLDAYGVP